MKTRTLTLEGPTSLRELVELTSVMASVLDMNCNDITCEIAEIERLIGEVMESKQNKQSKQ